VTAAERIMRLHPDDEGGPPAALFPSWDLGRMVLAGPGRPLVMGILNLTDDSFVADSRHADPAAAVTAALAMLAAGADILDLGAESTRPGAKPVPAAEEQARLLPVIEALRRETDAPLSVDTYRPETARRALDAGVDAINDITGGRQLDLTRLAAEAGCGLVLMHMQGDPRTMQDDPRYEDVVGEVAAWLAERAVATEAAGVAASRLLVDPGIGFGKTLAHNLALLAALEQVAGGRGLLLGASRKRFIGHLTGAAVADRLGGSLAAVAVAHAARAAVVRVHDVGATVQLLDVLAAVDQARNH
jgi:dihydropteroate synthase